MPIYTHIHFFNFNRLYECIMIFLIQFKIPILLLRNHISNKSGVLKEKNPRT